MQINSRRLTLVVISLAMALGLCSFGQDTSAMLRKALDLVRQVEAAAGNPTTNANKVDLLTQAITDAQQAPNHRLQGHRVLAIQAIRTAIAELEKGDVNHQAQAYLYTADEELSTSISLAGGIQPSTRTAVSSASAPIGQSADDCFKQGWAHMHQSNWQAAVADFDQAIKLDPAKTEAYMERGASKLMMGDRTGGMADYEEAIKLDPGNTEAHLHRAEALQGSDPKEAIAEYNQVIALDPKKEEAYRGVATTYWMHQDYKGTITAYDRFIAMNPKAGDAYGSRAIAKETKGDLDGAIADYGQAIQLEPTDFDAFHNRAGLETKKGDLQSALVDLNQAIFLGMHEGYVYRDRADIRKTLGDLAGALADYDKVVALNAGKDDAFVNLDEVYAGRGDVKLAQKNYDGAISDYNQAIALKDENTEQDFFYIWLAQNFEGRKIDADAQLSHEMADRLGFNWYWHGNIAKFLLGQLNEVDFMNAALSPDAKKAGIGQAWYYAGLKQLLAGNKSIASVDFKNCLAANPKDERTAFFAREKLKSMGQ